MGQLIISLDCEGKWGMADHLAPRHETLFTNEALEVAYAKILGLFARLELRASFAFVSAFTLSPDGFRANADLFRDTEIEGRNWLTAFRAALAAGNFEGWLVPRAFDMVRAHSEHEIACHGFSHVPLAENLVGEDVVRAELGAANKIAAQKGVTLKTFVYPRNQIGHTRVLTDFGYLGYRERPVPRLQALGKIAGLAEEFDIFSRAQPPAQASNPIRIPSGHFFNWRFGARKLVPPAVTVSRWRGIISDAIEHGRVAHLWLHPHNILDGPETFAVLQTVLEFAAQHRRAGRLEILTQREYCEAKR